MFGQIVNRTYHNIAVSTHVLLFLKELVSVDLRKFHFPRLFTTSSLCIINRVIIPTVVSSRIHLLIRSLISIYFVLCNAVKVADPFSFQPHMMAVCLSGVTVVQIYNQMCPMISVLFSFAIKIRFHF